MFPIKIGDKIYISPFHAASERGIWKYYDDSEDESECGSECESEVTNNKETHDNVQRTHGNSVFVGDGWEEINK